MHHLKFGDTQEWQISSYLLIHPFSFDRTSGNVISQPERARALFGAVSVERPVGGVGFRQRMPEGGRFRIVNGKTEIAILDEFDVRAISTPCSLDMSRALVVMHARQREEPQSRITVTPMQCKYADFGRGDRGGIQYWGAELRVGSAVYLRASLSVPTYRWGTSSLAEYCALGPANSEKAHGSIFGWAVEEGGRNSGDAPLPALTIHDVLHGTENELFGVDDSGVRQVARARGAVFMMNGLFVDWSWRELARFIQGIVEDQPDAVELVNLLPGTKVDQSVRHTHQPVQDELREPDTVEIDTADFEGIMVWGLDPRDEGMVAPVHG